MVKSHFYSIEKGKDSRSMGTDTQVTSNLVTLLSILIYQTKVNDRCIKCWMDLSRLHMLSFFSQEIYSNYVKLIKP